jgi:Flp pilus assembly protein TadD
MNSKNHNHNRNDKRDAAQIKKKRKALLVFFRACWMMLFSAQPVFAGSLNLAAQLQVHESYSLEAKGDVAGALNKILKLQQMNPDDYLLNYRLGYLMALNKKYPNARIHYEKAAQIQPKSLEPWLAISLMSLYSLDDSKVISASKEVLKRDPHHYTALQRLASAQIRAKNFDQALQVAETGVSLYPTDAIFLEQKAFALNALKKTDQAKSVAQTLILVSPTNEFAKSLFK